MCNFARCVALMTVVGAVPVSAVIIKDSTSLAGAAYYGIPDNAANQFNGVGSVNGNVGCTGFAISSTTVLTAAHCAGGSPKVTFSILDAMTNAFGPHVFTPDQVIVNPLFDNTNLGKGYDVAILKFNTPLPNAVTTFPLYQSDIGLGSNVELFGRGACGSPDTGFASCTDGNSLHRAMNRYDVRQNVTGGSDVFIFDFVNDYNTRAIYSGVNCPSTSALCYLSGVDFGSKDTGPGALLGKQGTIIYGDSGGPSLIFNQITARYEAVGVHSFVGCPGSPCPVPPGVHSTTNPDGSYGEYAGDTSLYSLRVFIATGANVPEPAAWMSAAAGLGVLILLRRKG